jgi:hypothetical protein
MDRKIVTPKGTVIQRCPQTGVGKLVGQQLYIHKSAAHRLPSNLLEAYNNAWTSKLHFTEYDADYWEPNCAVIELRTLAVRLDEAPDFDTAREPHVGRWFWYSQAPKIVQGRSNAIWHHKWLWVEDDYRGFNVGASFRWSAKYIPLIKGVPKASDKTWATQLAKAGLK